MENERIKHTENVIFNLPKDKISKTGLDIHEKENKIKSFAKKDTMDTIFNEWYVKKSESSGVSSLCKQFDNKLGN